MKILTAYYVLSAISNDYEDLDMVLSEVSQWARGDGISLAKEDVLAMLRHLIERGYARAYVKPTRAAQLTPVTLSDENVSRAYFFVSEKGKQLVMELDSLS
jgi:hypothetical protein